MEDLLGHVVEFVASIWEADTRIRDQSLLGESEFERGGRRGVAWVCGIIIVLLVVAMLWFAWRD